MWTLVQKAELMSCISFTLQYPEFLWHSIILSVTSATGQLFIFHTISRYGSLVFTIIMTTRQGARWGFFICTCRRSLLAWHSFSPCLALRSHPLWRGGGEVAHCTLLCAPAHTHSPAPTASIVSISPGHSVLTRRPCSLQRFYFRHAVQPCV